MIEKNKHIKEIINYIKKQNMMIEDIKKAKVIKLYSQFWTDLVKSDQKINKCENLMIYFNDYFIRNPI